MSTGHARAGSWAAISSWLWTPGSARPRQKADLWLPIRPGTDLAFLLALINVVISEGLYDAEFLRKFTNAPMLVAEDGTPLTAGTEGGKVVGVISLRDIISAIRE